MNPLHLIWIIPLCIWAGWAMCALFACAKDDPVREIKNVRSGKAGE